MGGMIIPMDVARKSELAFRDLGRVSYRDAYETQQALHAKVLCGESPPTILLLEHDPVITVTKRDGIAAHLLAPAELLRRDGIEVAQTDRGGDITYHGPGQLVAYPIIPLHALGMNVRQYVAALEDAVIDTLSQLGVTGQRDPAGIGVWVKESPVADRQSSKIAAIGVRVRRWVTLHGLALNVTTNLDHFRHIVPCGLPRPVTSLQQLLGENCPKMGQVKQLLSDALSRRLTTAEAP